ncbi:MAG TPA: transketolase C-terminal domain-containing protein [Candidatus Paceibacterota bacterium]|nr:transketolase C-terminal domain-containing protein [Candidatus Paceibacterota bacterium]
MLNPDAKLNPNLFDADVEQHPTRDGYGTGLVAAGDLNPNVVALSADLTESTRVEPFAKKFPYRFIELGVAEQNMATVAAGLGVTGKVAFISSYATFSPGRNWEQIRTTAAYNDANVKIAGHHAGISVGPDGATHQATEDIAIMRAIPHMRVWIPCDSVEARKATLAAAHVWGPVYLRFQREKTPVVTTDATPYTPGKAEVFWRSKKPEVLIIATGAIVHTALVAARELEDDGIGSIVLDCHTVKPLDAKTIAEFAKKIGAVVTAEEHQVQGGLGGAVAEALALHAPAPIEFIGMHDTFGESGPPDKLLARYGMTVRDIKAAAKKAIKRKK